MVWAAGLSGSSLRRSTPLHVAGLLWGEAERAGTCQLTRAPSLTQLPQDRFRPGLHFLFLLGAAALGPLSAFPLRVTSLALCSPPGRLWVRERVKPERQPSGSPPTLSVLLGTKVTSGCQTQGQLESRTAHGSRKGLGVGTGSP